MRVLLYTQPGCLSCELMKIFLEAKEIAFEERDIVADPEARRIMTEQYDSTRNANAGDFFRRNRGSDYRLRSRAP